MTEEDLTSITEAFIEGWRDPNPSFVSPRQVEEAEDEDARARLLGLGLREQYELMRSANGADFATDLAALRRRVADIRTRYSDNFIERVLPSLEGTLGFEKDQEA